MLKNIIIFILGLQVGLFAFEYSPLVQAIIDKDTKKAIKLIDNGADLSEYADEESIKKIITPRVKTIYIGGDKDKKVYPIVVLVASIGDVELLEKIKEKDKDALYLKDKYGNDALMWASREGYVDVVKFFLENGFDPLYKASNTTAFELSMQKQKYEVVNEIIKYLVDKKQTDILSYTMWRMARYDTDIVERLVKLGVKDTYKGSPNTLTKVVEIGNIKRFELLVKNGSNPYEKNKYKKNYTPLVAAINSRKFDMAKHLLENYHFDTNIKYKGKNLLDLAYNHYTGFDKKWLKLVLKHTNLDIKSKDKYGKSFLQKAIYNNDKEALVYFLGKDFSKDDIKEAIESCKLKLKINQKQYDKVNNEYNLKNLNISKEMEKLVLEYRK